jgi:hypothetical protein
VLSSITSGAVLADALAWTAQPVGLSGSAAVDQVEFLIDGRMLWTSKAPPYFFGGEHPVLKRLFPWMLGRGTHRFSVRVSTSTGKSASASALATVVVAHPVPRALVGTFTRHVTDADISRTQSFRHEPANQVLPAGVWRLHIGANGLISFDDPQGGGGTEAFTAEPSGDLAFLGPANWLVPPDRQGAFCEPEPDSSWHWAAQGRTVTLTPLHDTCADRNSMFAGRWNRS